MSNVEEIQRALAPQIEGMCIAQTNLLRKLYCDPAMTLEALRESREAKLLWGSTVNFLQYLIEANRAIPSRKREPEEKTFLEHYWGQLLGLRPLVKPDDPRSGGER